MIQAGQQYRDVIRKDLYKILEVGGGKVRYSVNGKGTAEVNEQTFEECANGKNKQLQLRRVR